MRAGMVAAIAALALVAGPSAAQQGPPPPLPLGDVRAPEVDERTLANGARLLVVPRGEVPFVTVNVVVPGGTAADPAGREGTATFVARLINRGTGSRDFAELASVLDRRGISMAAAAAEEWSTVSLNATTPALDVGLEVLAEVLVDATFPEDQVELTRTQARTGLQVQASRADALADLTFLKLVYGDHPYGRQPSGASVSAIARDDLVAYHDRWYRPDGAIIVVAGDVEPDDVAARLNDALAGWRPGPQPTLDFARAPDREQPEFVVVHRPGAVQAEIRIGHLLMGGEVEGWEELVVANQVLGGGPPGRLQQVLRNALGYTYDARSSVTRLRRLGLFRIVTATRPELAGAAVGEVFEQVERLRTRALPEGELADKVSYLVGSFPRSIETPQQVAGSITEQRLIGLSDETLERYRPRLAEVDTAAVRAAAETHIRPEQFLVVVSGDASVLQPQLRAFGEVRIVDADGAPLTLADLNAAPERFDLSALAPDTLVYDVLVGGVRRGSATRTLEAVDEGWRFASVIEAGVQRIEQAMVVDQAMRMVSSSTLVAALAGDQTIAVDRRGDHLVGERRSGEPPTPIDLEVPEGVTLSDGIELALWASPLEVGREIRLPVVDLAEGAVQTVVLRVEERTDLTIGAGTFDTFRVSVGGDDPQTYYVLAEGPHIAVRMESASRPIALELIAPPALAQR
ncbi:insulinase family protein [Gaopeijia maritima]|uniref:Insulinase family protein n=1 Tax=Gaopeijia maritima TaxID=3119007 RepID=A0ABU9ECN5_9BACT